MINICFHGIGTPARQLEPGESRYWISERQFAAILDEIVTWPSVQVSFDDGNQSDLEFGLPALVQRNLTGIFFPLAGRLGKPGSVDAAAVRELSAAGMTVGSHGMDHRPWRGMDAATSKRELVDAQQEIAAVTGRQVDQAALPLGRYDRRLLRDLEELGYRTVHTSDRRIAKAGSWIQPRFSVRDDDTVQSIRAAIDSAKSPIRSARLHAVGMVKRLR